MGHAGNLSVTHRPALARARASHPPRVIRRCVIAGRDRSRNIHSLVSEDFCGMVNSGAAQVTRGHREGRGRVCLSSVRGLLSRLTNARNDRKR